ncbi:MAG: sugar kinase [Crocinitomicaceae bacterium]|nr:sugar kinase [Crocinitomicaceae bacterium]|tara:strand:- start:11754 stop:12683 length:930 start_codon:yes stop_codon:yes gene_type:complete
MSLLTVGSIAFDRIETPFGKTEKIVGGAGTYIALAASLYNNNQTVISIVGEDFPEKMLNEFRNRKINLDGLQIIKGEKTFFWSGKYSKDMNSRQTLVTELNVLEHFNPIVPENYQGIDYLMLGNLSPEVQFKVIEQLKIRPKLIAMDTMNFWMDVSLDQLKKTISMVDLIIINDEEARQLSNEYSLISAAKTIRKMGPKFVIIKKGEHGALLFYEENIFHAPALPLEQVFDPTGAGDTFAGGFMGYISSTDNISFENMKSAIIHGSALASYCVEDFGIKRLQKITKKDLENRICQFVELTKFNVIDSVK